MQQAARSLRTFGWLVAMIAIGCRSPRPAAKPPSEPATATKPVDAAIATPSDAAAVAVVPDAGGPRPCPPDAAAVRACEANGPQFVYTWRSEIRCQGVALPENEEKKGALHETCECFDRLAEERERERCSMVK
jgi:hypothetical protein